MPATWVATREIPLAKLARFPGNARRGNVAQIRASVRRHGQYRSLIVRDCPDGLIILAGNHTADALKAEGGGTARCEVITCTDDEARRINLADNKLAELGGYDGDALAELLSYLDDDYEGTGYEAWNVESLITPPEPGDSETPSARPQRGQLLELARVTIGEPRHIVQHGQIWALGTHRLAVADVFTDWPLWVPLLTDGTTFMPYPTPLVPHAPAVTHLVMVQPEPYLAGHLLDKWEDITGSPPAVVSRAAA